MLTSNGEMEEDDDDFIEKEPTKKKSAPDSSKMVEWREDEDQRLKSYFNMYKDSVNAIDLVMASMGAQRTAAEVYKRLDQLNVLTKTHKKTFAEIAKEADVIIDNQKLTAPVQQTTDKRSICQQLASARGRGPKALAWLKEKVEEAALLRDRFEMNDSDTSDTMSPYDIVPVDAEEEKFVQCCAKLLSVLGFAPPRRGKAAFWSIPAKESFTASVLRSRVVDVITQSIKFAALVKSKAASRRRSRRNESDSEEEEDDHHDVASDGDSDDGAVVEAAEPQGEPTESSLESSRKQRRKTHEELSKKGSTKHHKHTSDGSSDEEPEKRKKTSKKKHASKDSDDESEAGSSTQKRNKEAETNGEAHKKNKKKVRIAEDSDTERPRKGVSKRKGEEDMETHTPVKKRLRKNLSAEESVEIAPPLSLVGEESMDIAAPLSVDTDKDELDTIFEKDGTVEDEQIEEESEQPEVLVRVTKHKRLVRVESDEEDD